MHPRESADRAGKEQPECVKVPVEGKKERQVVMMDQCHFVTGREANNIVLTAETEF